MRQLKLVILFCVLWFFSSAQNITTAEYFFDGNDNGLGNNTTIAITQIDESFNVITTGLSNGFHDLYVRVFDQAANEGNGGWSHYDRSTFYSSDFLTGQNIVAARYYIDNNASVMLDVNPMTTQITESYSLSIGSLDEGFHSFHIEAQDSDGTWSDYDRAAFYVADFPSDQNIVAARYFFNDDVPVSLDVDPMSSSITESYIISTVDLEEGFHSFYVQTQVEDGTWSHYDRQIIYINDFSDIPDDIVAAEYFIDDDPGFGQGISFDITAPNPLLVTTDMNIEEGDHSFCIRVQNSNGDWSLYCCATFNVDEETASTVESLYKSTTIFPNPFENDIQIESTLNHEFEKIIVVDLTGKIVFESSSDLNRIALGTLSKGVYILRLITNKSEANFKIVKK